MLESSVSCLRLLDLDNLFRFGALHCPALMWAQRPEVRKQPGAHAGSRAQLGVRQVPKIAQGSNWLRTSAKGVNPHRPAVSGGAAQHQDIDRSLVAQASNVRVLAVLCFEQITPLLEDAIGSNDLRYPPAADAVLSSYLRRHYPQAAKP